MSRVFSEGNPTTGVNKWYFQTREGYAGSFESQEIAEEKLKQFIKASIDAGDTGGRGTKETNPIKLNAKKQRLLDFNLIDRIS